MVSPLKNYIAQNSEDRGVSGLAKKRVAADVPGLGEVKYRCSGVGYGSEFGPVPWPLTEPSCCEALESPAKGGWVSSSAAVTRGDKASPHQTERPTSTGGAYHFLGHDTASSWRSWIAFPIVVDWEGELMCQNWRRSTAQPLEGLEGRRRAQETSKSEGGNQKAAGGGESGVRAARTRGTAARGSEWDDLSVGGSIVGGCVSGLA
ncbi:hypothetical protein JTB14_023583 [Gonioctena quinquepunctata]|nr:hypothetical protein JTB14_023583 [Gonioctena quinquepunctata]